MKEVLIVLTKLIVLHGVICIIVLCVCACKNVSVIVLSIRASGKQSKLLTSAVV